MGFKTINDFPESTSPSGNWYVLVDDGTGCYKKVKLSNLPGGGGTTSTTSTSSTSTTSTSSTSSTSTTTTTSCEVTDVTAQAFITATGITSCSVKSAINTLVINLKATTVWNKLRAIYPFVGGSSQSANAVNLKDPTIGTYNLTFNGTGWIFHGDNSGVTPNGTTNYANTGFIPNTVYGSSFNRSLGVYSAVDTTISGGAFHYQMGAYDNSVSPATELSIFFWDNGGTQQQASVMGDQQFIQVAPKNSFSGFHVSTRVANNDFKYYRNNVLQGSNTNAVSVSSPINEIFLFAVNGPSGAGSFSTEKLSFAFIGDGLTPSEVALFNTAVNTFQTSLGRAVV